MNKQIIGIVATLLMLGTALSPAPIQSGNIDFVITIQKDASISISSLNTVGGSALQFEPGINTIAEDEYALPKNNATETDPHWTITNIGNVPSNIRLQLNSSLPSGIQVEVGINKAYNINDYVNITDHTQNWLYNTTSGTDGAPLNKAQTTNFWQRIAADLNAVGGTNASLKVVITSIPQ